MWTWHIAGRSLASASSAARGPTNGIALTNNLSALMPRIQSMLETVPCHPSSNGRRGNISYVVSMYADYCTNSLSHDVKVMRHRPNEPATAQKGMR